MKILDATILIVIFKELKCATLIDSLLKLNHILVIPQHLLRKEILDELTLQGVTASVTAKKFTITNHNNLNEIKTFQNRYPNLGLGECDVILTCQKGITQNENIYCILDDKSARSVAKKLNIPFMGFLGLLKLMKVRNILSDTEIKHIHKKLKQTSFHCPTNFII